MDSIFGISTPVLMGQLLIGLINGSFYAVLSLGLAVIFGMLNIINFAHGAQYMLGALVAYLLLQYFGINYWAALILAPLIVGSLGILVERLMLKRLYKLDHLYGLLFTFGLALVIQGLARYQFGASGMNYPVPDLFRGGYNLGFMFLPAYRGWVVVISFIVCLLTWLAIEKTKIGAMLRAATENPMLVRAFGINVPLIITLTYGFGVALAAFAGVLAAPIYSVNPLMGADLIVVVFAVVVIGGMGSIGGAIVTGLVLGVVEGLTKVFFPEASNIVVFVIMAIVLVFKPNGLFGKEVVISADHDGDDPADARVGLVWRWIILAIVGGLLVAAPFFFYPTFIMKMLCFALFACAFNLLLGYGGLLSFGHAMFFGWAGYICAHAVKVWGLTPELGIVAGAGTAALLGLVGGAIAIRSKGIYFAMITLALAQMMYFVALQTPFTGGEDGIQRVPRGALFGVIPLGNELAMYYFVVVVVALGLFAIYRVINSPFGEVLKAIRDNEQRAVSLGYSVSQYKLIAFVLSAALTGVAGATKVLVFQLASLTDVHWTMSGEVVLMTMLGGMGTIFGPAVGASMVVGLQNFFATTGEWVTVIQGAIFILCVLVFRRGIVGETLRIWGAASGRKRRG